MEEVPGAAAAAPAQRQLAPVAARALNSDRSPTADTGAVAALLKELDAKPPEKWLERIEELKRQGRGGEAEAMLTEFKGRFPNHPLPAGLR